MELELGIGFAWVIDFERRCRFCEGRHSTIRIDFVLAKADLERLLVQCRLDIQMPHRMGVAVIHERRKRVPRFGVGFAIKPGLYRVARSRIQPDDRL